MCHDWCIFSIFIDKRDAVGSFSASDSSRATGGFTTFSSFALDAHLLTEEGKWIIGFIRFSQRTSSRMVRCIREHEPGEELDEKNRISNRKPRQ